MSEKRISLIIPTRERANTLYYTLQTALDQTSDDYEVLVSDNHSRDHTRDVVESFHDPRLRYVNTGKRLSMSDNWEFAMEHVKGRFISIIGDDDAVFPRAIDSLLNVMDSHPASAYRWNFQYYFWPMWGQPARALAPAPIGPPRTVDLEAKAKSVYRRGGWQYGHLSGVYHSLVSRSILDELHRRTGRMFHTLCPDIFTLFAVAGLAGQSVDVGRPITCYGISAKSNTGNNLTGKGTSVRDYITEYKEVSLHPTLVSAPEGGLHVSALVGDSMLRARDFFPETFGDTPFNYAAFWGCSHRLKLVTLPGFLRLASAIREKQPCNIGKALGWILAHQVLALLARTRETLRGLRAGKENVPDNIVDFVKQRNAMLESPSGERMETP